MRTKILIIILSLSFSYLSAQEADTVVPTIAEEKLDSNVVKERIPFKQKLKAFPSKFINYFDDEQPRPNKALWMTFVLPGSGQAYNGKHWKIPIVYVGVGALSYAIAFNTRQYKRYKTAYIYRLDDDINTTEPTLTQELTDAALQNIREGYRKDLERSYMGLLGFYALVGVDAFVDAHLQGFDVSDDLSLQLKPSLQRQSLGNPSAGMTLGLTFGNRKKDVLMLNEEFELVSNSNVIKIGKK
ncbi:MAG: hypothetical protein ACI94Y_001429 [Maribacter sp.]|jgi:hypothetical protein